MLALHTWGFMLPATEVIPLCPKLPSKKLQSFLGEGGGTITLEITDYVAMLGVPDTLSVHGCLREQIYGLRLLASHSHYSPTRRPIAILLAMWLCDVAARATSSHVGCRKRVGAHTVAGAEPRISYHLTFLAQTFIYLFFFTSCGAGDEVKIYVLLESNLPRPPHLFSLFP